MSLGAPMSLSFPNSELDPNASTGGTGTPSNSFSVPTTSPADLVTQGILDQISATAQSISAQMLSWGQGVFANVNSVTGSNIGQFMNNAASAGNLATASVNDYLSKYVPLQDQLIQDANSYTSDARKKLEMGAAESATAQSMSQGISNAENQLQSYGIDPSSGRYAELEDAQQSAKAAAMAGAGQQAERSVEATGRGLRANAIAVGQQLPGQAVNALNSGVQALTGAENSVLGAANTGVNLTNPGLTALKTAADAAKYPPNAQISMGTGAIPAGNAANAASQAAKNAAAANAAKAAATSKSAPGSNSFSTPGSPGANTWSAPRPGVSPGIAYGDPFAAPGTGTGNTSASANQTGFSPPVGYDPNAVNGGTSAINGTDPSWLQPAGDFQQPNGYGFNQDGTSGTMGTPANPFAGTPTDLPAWNTSGDTSATTGGYSPGGFDNSTSTDTSNSDPFGNNFNYDTAGATSDPWGGGGSANDYSNSDTSTAADYSGYNSSPQDYGNSYNSDTSTAYDYSGYDSGGDYSGGFAKGGAIPDVTSGGRIPPSASPSMGRRTDDIHASLNGQRPGVNVNAGEFIVPKDVAAWKGQEFFQKLIAQARKARVTAPAHGTPSPAMG